MFPIHYKLYSHVFYVCTMLLHVHVTFCNVVVPQRYVCQRMWSPIKGKKLALTRTPITTWKLVVLVPVPRRVLTTDEFEFVQTRIRGISISVEIGTPATTIPLLLFPLQGRHIPMRDTETFRCALVSSGVTSVNKAQFRGQK